MSRLRPEAGERRVVAGLWFAAVGFLVGALFVLHGPVAVPAAILYLALPSFSAGAAGYAWGGSILDTSKNWGESLLRSVMVTAGAYAIFAPLYACGLVLLERGWSVRQIGGLLLLTLTLGLLAAGPVMLLAGMVGGLALHRIGRCGLLQAGTARKTE